MRALCDVLHIGISTCTLTWAMSVFWQSLCAFNKQNIHSSVLYNSLDITHYHYLVDCMFASSHAKRTTTYLIA
ncbi:hypothetical protein BDB00DRAFT_826114 [Zychaea mexicana]|uniref:uncharacterized protein n=1 Tax=Zychaea mexicana TaxID=64656 RepID=UPI0022FF3DF7|nr:uncharacterized protein BDB00DRAFT_826114 [Zychaea mexicana]KAI9492907.1 hypothetical protein BDB00DRAFT_826114 [Zychaea mexicana]